MPSSVPVIATSVIRIPEIIKISSIIFLAGMLHDMVLLTNDRKEPHEHRQHLRQLPHSRRIRPPRAALSAPRPRRATPAPHTGRARLRAAAPRRAGLRAG